MSDVLNFTQDDYVRKIAGLLATAESFAEQGNDEAAQAYVEKAHALQQKYSIDSAMVAERTGQQIEKIISKPIKMPGKYGKRKVHLAHVIAHATHCTGYFGKSYAGQDIPDTYYYMIFGFEKDVEHVEFLINSLCVQMDAAHKRAVAFDKPSWEHGKTFGASFMMGYASSISSRLKAANRQAVADAVKDAANTGSCVSLVLADKKAKVEAEMRARIGKLGKGSSSSATSGSGYSSGRTAGNGATIARGATGSGSRGSLSR